MIQFLLFLHNRKHDKNKNKNNQPETKTTIINKINYIILINYIPIILKFYQRKKKKKKEMGKDRDKDKMYA